MKLYYFPGACPLVTHIVLEWIGKPYETKRVTREQIKQPEYLALNPAGSVPTLVDGDFVLTQSVAILEYLAELHPEAKLLGSDIRSRAETRRWLGMCNSDLHRSFTVLVRARSYLDDNEAAARVLARNISAKLHSLLKVANDRLAGRDWLTGQRSVADAYLYVILTWADARHLDITDLPELRRFQRRMSLDPGVKAAIAAESIA